MDNQISAVCSVFWDDGEKVYRTEYVALCGCNWVVDMWGNVRRVVVCSSCMKTDPAADQLLFFDLTPESAADG